MKRLNLDDTWKYCLQMWKWVAKEHEKKGGNVGELKIFWLEKHDINTTEINSGCFFCYYAEHRMKGIEDDFCNNCPAKKIDRSFDCENDEYDYWDYPVEFYAELVRLNKLRLAKRKR